MIQFALGATAALTLLTPLIGLAQADPGRGSTTTIEIPFKSHDGHRMLGKLTMPVGGGPYPVVIYAQTAEGMTVDMKRRLSDTTTFNFFDLYATKLPEMNIAFFCYEGRGIRNGSKPPRFEEIDTAAFNTGTLENKVQDLISALRVVQQQGSIDSTKIELMGASEGTLLIAEATSRAPSDVAGLVMYGVLAEPLRPFCANKSERVRPLSFAEDAAAGNLTGGGALNSFANRQLLCGSSPSVARARPCSVAPYPLGACHGPQSHGRQNRRKLHHSRSAWRLFE